MARRRKPMNNSRKMVSETCLELSRRRLAHIFDRFDQIFVSFSGGKDSTVCLQLALEMARETGRLPLKVFSFDEEAIPPETVEYMARVAAWPDVDFRWYCVPIQHRNACSSREPYWYTWEPEKRHLWVRDLPPTAITSFEGMTRQGIEEQTPALFRPSTGTVCNIMGIRSQESLTRYTMITSKVGFHSFLKQRDDAPWITKAYPIYDWRTEDVWRAPDLFGWDYNRAYDVMQAAGMPLSLQRCAPPYGAQPIRRLHTYKTCWPDLWAKMVDRVHGAATAARYANTSLYGMAVAEEDLPEGMSWQELTMQTMAKLDAESRREVSNAISTTVRMHRNRTRHPVPDAEPDPLSGLSWKILYGAARIGSDKFGRTQQKIRHLALVERQKRGVL